ncbi:MAG: hypothetical protein IJT68_06785 [Lentisphaeria bacterium]|nr:hypothetical protein [Lentisphaeria bacterium]MBR3505613.1 hypothetical protein [Lentisphaeria bacterium]
MFSKLVTGIGESLNPVFIKEMRQYFQNRRMIIFMGMLLLAQFIVTLFFSSAMRFSGDDDSSGVGFFLLIIFAGAILAVIICAIGAEQRFAEERSDKELNYAMLTTLRPASIIWGKLEGAIVMLFCIFSMLLPFLTAAYFMRGLSAASLLVTLCLFPILVLYSLAGIFAGSFGMKWITGLFFVGIFGSMVFLMPFAFEIVDDLMNRSDLGTAFWVGILIEYKLAFLLGVLLFLLALAVVSPPKSNRFCAAKAYLFLLPAIALVLMTPYYFIFGGSGTSYDRDFFYVIEFLFCAFSFGVTALVAVCEPPVNSIRIYMKCPRNFFGRVLHFLFSSGFAGTVLLTIPVLALPAVLTPFAGLSWSGVTTVYGMLCILVSFLGFALLALNLGLRTKLRFPPLGWLVILEVGANILTWIPASIMDFSMKKIPGPVRLISMVLSHLYCFVETVDAPSASTAASSLPLHALMVSSGITFILFLCLLPLIVKAFRQHRYPDNAAKPPTKEMLRK